MNLNDRSPVIQLQITISVFRLNYAFHLIVEGLMVCTFSGVFCMNYRFVVTRLLNHQPNIRNFDEVSNTVADAFHHLVPNDNFHCQTHLKNAKFDLLGDENAIWQMWLQIAVG